MACAEQRDKDELFEIVDLTDADEGRLVVVAVLIPLRRPNALRTELSGGGADRWLEDRQKAATERAGDHVDASVTALGRHVYSGWEWYPGGSTHRNRVTNGVRFEYYGGQTCRLAVEVDESSTVKQQPGGWSTSAGFTPGPTSSRSLIRSRP